MKRPKSTPPIVLTITLLVVAEFCAGCGSADQRLAELANENARRQAAQNQEMARLHREIAEGTRCLVSAGAEATDKLIAASHDLDRQRAQLDAERQALAAERNRESILGPTITTIGWLFICCLPLVLCWHLLRGLGHHNDDDAIGQLLVEEFVSDRPTLLPVPSKNQDIEHPSPPAPTAGPNSQPEA